VKTGTYPTGIEGEMGGTPRKNSGHRRHQQSTSNWIRGLHAEITDNFTTCFNYVLNYVFSENYVLNYVLNNVFSKTLNNYVFNYVFNHVLIK
jgi:hypothetical protein